LTGENEEKSSSCVRKNEGNLCAAARFGDADADGTAIRDNPVSASLAQQIVALGGLQRDYTRARRFSRTNPGGRIFEYHAVRRRKTQKRRTLQEWLRMRFAVGDVI
jgi:hypothetical protein